MRVEARAQKVAHPRISAPFEYEGETVCHIALSNGGLAMVNAADVPLVANKCWHRSKDGYAIGKNARLHRMILAPPAGKEIDHINGDKLDNRRKNLRIVTHHENMLGYFPRRESPTFGVRFVGNGRFGARYLKKWLGTFRTIEDALAAVKRAVEAHGDQKQLGGVLGRAVEVESRGDRQAVKG